MAEDYRKEGGEDKDFLEEVRENHQSALEAFQPTMDEGDRDIDFILNDGWPEAEKALRRKSGSERPMISCDQLNQYTNLVINEVRQHPRQIKISPDGYGATAQLAEIRENRLRSIQYKSDAQAAYLTAMENACQRSYAYARVTLVYASETSIEQDIRIQRIPNPNSVLFDPACREIDCSDAEFCFVLENFTKRAFKRRWPDATQIDFDGQMSNDYPMWIKDKYIQVAEYWKVHKKKDILFVMDSGDGHQRTELESKLLERGGSAEESHIFYPPTDGNPEGLKLPLITHRDTKTSKVVQYITNGVEKLEANEWIGKWIPIVPLFGKEVYRSNAGRSSKVLMSLIRNAREPQMAYNYFMTTALEAVGQVPRATYKVLEGTIDGYEKDWQEAHHVPKAWLTYKAALQPDGSYIAQAPEKDPFDPPLQNLMIGVESFLRAIQSAVGMYNTSVGKADSQVDSGVAIKQLDAQSDQGAFHFIDNYNRFQCAVGRICNDLLGKVDANPRQVTVRTKDNKDQLIWVNKPYKDDAGNEQNHDMSLGEYGVTIGVEPTADSQREAASDFLEKFVEEFIPLLQDEPAKRDALMALGIEIKQLGPIAEQMVKILNPDQGDPAQMQQNLQQLQSQLQQLQVENAALLQDKAARVLEQQTKIKIEEMKQEGAGAKDAAEHSNQISLANMQIWAKVIVAELAKQSKATDQKAQQDAQAIENALGAAHEAGLQATDHAHEHSIADKQAATAAAQQAAQAATQQQSQAADQAHQQTMAEEAQQNQPEG